MQVIIPPEERERLIALGSTGIIREIAEGKHCEPTAPYRDAVDALLASVKASEDAAALARAEAREERMVAISERNVAISESALSIATRDLETAREQATWAKWAAVAAVIALIISKADDISKLFP
ncbi:MAG: hypothetical protein K8F26_13505 [Thiobacillus sp.]|nr:hypothetical protein [Thiobacillus sp.]